MNKTIEEIRIERMALEQGILSMLREFSESTGVDVCNLSIETVEQLTTPRLFYIAVNAEIKI